MPAELKEAFDKLYLVDFAELVEDKTWVKRELANTEKQLRSLVLKEELKSLAEKLKVEDDEKKSEKIREKIRGTGRKLTEEESK